MFKIGAHAVGSGAPVFVVAEISGNHHQRYEEAQALVRAAKDAGANAVKIQTYTPDTITLNSSSTPFIVKGADQPEDWKGERLFDLYQRAHTPWEWQPKLRRFADELGITLFSTPFDDSAVDFLEHKVGVPCYKIASYEAVHIPLLRAVARTGKPVILSIGYASVQEAAEAIQTLRDGGAHDIATLHCVTAYSRVPDLAHMNFATIADIRKRFQVVAGFSDNNGGILAPIIAAVSFDASIIEKHLILSRKEGGPDAQFSLEPEEFADMVRRIRLGEKRGVEAAIDSLGTSASVEEARGSVHYGPASPQEMENIIFRPSIWAARDIRGGEEFTAQNIRIARPGHGLAPKHWDAVVGKHARRDITFATPLLQDLIVD
jgi:N-acetylneuraminate synthase